jgi:hypothetical protein
MVVVVLIVIAVGNSGSTDVGRSDGAVAVAPVAAKEVSRRGQMKALGALADVVHIVAGSWSFVVVVVAVAAAFVPSEQHAVGRACANASEGDNS